MSNPGTTGLVSWWELNETSGTRVDAHGSNDLTDVNTVGNAAAIVGNGADLERGNSEYFSSSAIPIDATTFSLSFWFRPESTPGFMGLYMSGTATNFWRVGVSSSNRLTFTEQDIMDYSGSTSISSSTWYHGTIVKDGNSGTNLTIYINGVSDGTFSVGSVVAPTGNVTIGAYSTNGTTRSLHFDGTLDEFSVWDKALTPSEVSWLYNSGSGRSYADLSGGPLLSPYIPQVSFINRTISSPFSPNDVSGLTLWLDADDASTITASAGSVSQWDDKSGNDNHVSQSNGSKQPSTGTRTINGRNALDFDGTNHALEDANFTFPSEYTLFIVANVDAVGNVAESLFSIESLTAGNDFQLDAARASEFVYRYNVGSGDASTYEDIDLIGQTSIFGLRADTTQGDMLVNGGSPDNLDATKPDMGGSVALRLMTNRSDSQELDGAMCEVLLYSRKLTNIEQNTIGNYLANKWGVTWTNIPTLPTQISNLSLWLDAADASTITSSAGSVSQWDDKSGNGYHLAQSAGADQPSTGTRTMNSLNVIDFTEGQFLERSGILGLPANPGLAAFFVIEFDTNVDNTDRYFTIFAESGAVGEGISLSAGAEGYSYRFNNGRENFNATVLATPQILLSERPVGSTYNGGFFYLNGGTAETTTGSAGGLFTPNITSPNTTILGAGIPSVGNITFFIDAAIAEVIVFSEPLGERDTNIIGNYLAEKWNITWTNI